MSVVFYDWPYSPFCMKVRAILDYKSIDYQTVKPLAARGELRRRGTGKVPAVEIDGTFITDSTDIAYALQERFPDPPLLPPTEHERGLSHAIRSEERRVGKECRSRCDWSSDVCSSDLVHH